jgi:hypothetical protein
MNPVNPLDQKLSDENEAEVEAIRAALKLLPYGEATDAVRSRAFEGLGWLTGTIKGLNRRIDYMADELAFEKKLGRP